MGCAHVCLDGSWYLHRGHNLAIRTPVGKMQKLKNFGLFGSKTANLLHFLSKLEMRFT
jgi:hypothetical protein